MSKVLFFSNIKNLKERIIIFSKHCYNNGCKRSYKFDSSYIYITGFVLSSQGAGNTREREWRLEERSRDGEFSPLGMEYATLFPCTRDIIRVIERGERVCIRFVTHVAVSKFAHRAIYLRDNRAGSRFVPS